MISKEWNPGKKGIAGIVFGMSVDMISNKNQVLKEARLSTTHFLMEITNKRELQQVVINHSSDTDFKDFIKIYKKCTTEKYRYLVTDMTLTSDNPLRLKKIF